MRSRLSAWETNPSANVRYSDEARNSPGVMRRCATLMPATSSTATRTAVSTRPTCHEALRCTSQVRIPAFVSSGSGARVRAISRWAVPDALIVRLPASASVSRAAIAVTCVR